MNRFPAIGLVDHQTGDGHKFMPVMRWPVDAAGVRHRASPGNAGANGTQRALTVHSSRFAVRVQFRVQVRFAVPVRFDAFVADKRASRS